jgi:uncharacterized protein DUF3943
VTPAVLAAWLAAVPLDPPAAPTGTLTITPALSLPVNWTVPVAHAAGVLMGMRVSLSLLWPRAYDPFPLERSARQLGAAFRAPPELRRDRSLLESDGDPWAINVVGHGLFGAEIYGRVRQCGGAPWQALAFTAGTSAVWEYGIESWSKRPSAIDLVTTPLIGAAIGEARVSAQRWLHHRPRGFLRTLGEIFVDPLGEAERGILQTRC